MDQPIPSRFRRTGLAILVAGSILIGSGAVWAQSDSSTPSAEQSTSTPTSSDSTSSSSDSNRLEPSDSSRDSGRSGSSDHERNGSRRMGAGSLRLDSVWIEQGIVSPAAAISTAQSELGGTFTGFGMTLSSDDVPVYLVQIDDQIIAVGGSSGEVIDASSSSQEDATTAVNDSETTATPAANTESADDSATAESTSNLATLLSSATVSPVEAAGIAQSETGDTPTSIRLRVNDDGVLIYSVRTETQSVRINAATGDVLEVVDRESTTDVDTSATPSTDGTVATPAA